MAYPRCALRWLYRFSNAHRSVDVYVRLLDRHMYRPSSIPRREVIDDFLDGMEENFDRLRSDTVHVTLLEVEHRSPLDNRLHYTAEKIHRYGRGTRIHFATGR
ncbi:hypothetical protein CC86DRAFT_402118 [Ophiobolus disseminans]|uniref:Uncharacterized protein n=1 Tax=Ophiobolus disseminans TaxID=1469910 RepID=A0A6A7AEF8_9PLEO|nr:hypothetical protein CC86DRAFT_402118 [Ophiobolus disseminans]